MLRFGTDGVRGRVGDALTVESVLALGRAAARALGGPEVAVGRDTRRSGAALESALAAGMAAEGVRVVRLGVVPTPVVAFVSERRSVPGAVISASHNPWTDNGVKFFGPDGRKVRDEIERAIQEHLERLEGPPGRDEAPGGSDHPGRFGDVVDDRADVQAWMDHIAGALEGRRLDGVRIVVDAANGAASALAPEVLGRLGAHVEVLAGAPDGTNINDNCGSTHPDAARTAVLETGADLGVALDGDADRCLGIDEQGRLVDGDQLLALLAGDMRSRGALPGDAVVVTVMTNLGFRQAMTAAGIEVHETPVGDRHVLARLDEQGLGLGGEQSGHIIVRRHATTGDGTLTAVLLADLLARSGRPLSALVDDSMVRLPQVLCNVRVSGDAEAVAAGLVDAVAAASADLGSRGRVLVRPSGTEPLVRVMVEAPTAEEAGAVAGRLAELAAGVAAPPP